MPTPPPIPYDHLPEVPALTVEAPGLSDGQTMSTRHVFNDWGFSGENVSPALTWSGAPEGTLSYAVTCFDPDAPTGSGFWHWLLFDIPASVTELPEGAGNGPDFAGLPEGAEPRQERLRHQGVRRRRPASRLAAPLPVRRPRPRRGRSWTSTPTPTRP